MIEPNNGWVSVWNDKPPVGVRVLTWVEDFYHHWLSVDSWEEHPKTKIVGWRSEWHGLTMHNDITHWRLSPKGPYDMEETS